MEENVSLLEEIHQVFGECDIDIRTYSPLTFAYIGDAIFEMVIRTLIVERGQRAANTLHKHTTKIVCAGTQAAIVEAIMEDMTQEEHWQKRYEEVVDLSQRKEYKASFLCEECVFIGLPQGNRL